LKPSRELQETAEKVAMEVLGFAVYAVCICSACLIIDPNKGPNIVTDAS
jgi:hypothetical protein